MAWWNGVGPWLGLGLYTYELNDHNIYLETSFHSILLSLLRSFHIF